MRKLIFFTVLLAAVGFGQVMPQSTTKAQDIGNSTCSIIASEAVTSSANVCKQIGRNRICYGNSLVSADSRLGVADFAFETPGDVSRLAEIESIRLSGMDEIEGYWGIVQMQLQASIPAAKPQDVTLVAFGEVDMKNGTSSDEPVNIVVENLQGFNLYVEPRYGSDIAASVEAGTELTAYQRSADNNWLVVNVPDVDNAKAWVRTSAVSSEADLSLLAIADESTVAAYTPMQAFYFSAADNSTCSEVPQSGMLVQTPEGIAEVTLLINEVNIQLGSTAYIQATPGQTMRITMLEGQASITAQGVTQEVPAGYFSDISISEELAATSSPSNATLIGADQYANLWMLPLSLLEKQFIMPWMPGGVTETVSEIANGGKVTGLGDPHEEGETGNPHDDGETGNPHSNSPSNAGGNSGGNSGGNNGGGGGKK